MRARLRYLLISPKTPQYLSHRSTEIGAVLLTVLGFLLAGGVL